MAKTYVSTAVVVAGLALGAGILGSGAGPASAATGSLNPMGVNGLFTIVTTADATMGNGELEGSLAVGGDVRFPNGTYPIIHSSGLTPTDYDIPVVAGDPTRLLTGGTFVPGNNGEVTVDSRGYVNDAQRGFVKIGDLTDLQVTERGAGAIWVANGPSGTEQGIYNPNQLYNGGEPASRVGAPGAYDAYFADLEVSSDDATECLTELTPVESDEVHVSTLSPGGNAAEMTVDLEAGKTNVLEIPYAQLSTFSVLRTTGAALAADTPLVVRVVGAPDGATIDLPQFAGTESPNADQPNPVAPYVLYDFSSYAEGTSLTIGGDTLVSGSIYAPGLDLTVDVGTPVEGQIFTDTLTTGGGEIHHYLFLGEVSCGDVEPSPSPTEPTPTEPTPTDPTPTEPTPTDPTPSESPSEPAPTESPSEPEQSDAVPSAPADSSGPEVSTSPVGSETLPATGSPVSVLGVAIGVALLSGGALLIMFARRQRS
ncbi:collagen-binding domain-containing protein [Nocardioides sp. NPDC059952]|uniref:collagen-binding domain-containing protein n=1 Tax=Nocardioides sp. NPDC059952 TaxID=3347014 RepID=UPI00364685A8